MGPNNNIQRRPARTGASEKLNSLTHSGAGEKETLNMHVVGKKGISAPKQPYVALDP